MPLLHLTTFIAAPIEMVFDLSRSIDLHKNSMIRFKEKPVAGKISGLIGLNETVTWQAMHLGKQRTLTVRITNFQKPHAFTDEQVKGDFKTMKHEHRFESQNNGTIMTDIFYFESPFGVLGKWLNKVYLTPYMKNLLEERNAVLKQTA